MHRELYCKNLNYFSVCMLLVIRQCTVWYVLWCLCSQVCPADGKLSFMSSASKYPIQFLSLSHFLAWKHKVAGRKHWIYKEITGMQQAGWQWTSKRDCFSSPLAVSLTIMLEQVRCFPRVFSCLILAVILLLLIELLFNCLFNCQCNCVFAIIITN